MTRSERVIAAYLRAHARELPFETAASIARKVGVSPMTVGRFLRGLGYDGLSAVKAELSSTLQQVPWLVGERYARAARVATSLRGARAERDLARSLDLELKAVVSAYELARSRRFASLAREAANRGIHLAAVTDAVCPWAADYADDLFQISTDVGLFWDSNGPLTTFLNLLVDHSIRQPAGEAAGPAGRVRELPRQGPPAALA
jgi:DNA-binding MurR/RpiR family transcriptional regulator